jgi:predicted ATPase
MVLESGLVRQTNHHYELTGPLPPLAIPSTLQDSLMARLDRLGAVKETAQLGAILGREFPYELVQAVSPVDEPSLQRALAQLVEVEVLYQRGLAPQARYVFKHALIQEAAYHSLLKSRRQHYHRQIARVLEEQFPDTQETQPELLAHHYTEAGLIAQAIPYWQQAGRRAGQRSAHVEAISHLTKGLGLLQTLPQTPEHPQLELTLQMALGSALMATKGYAAREVEHAFARARELCAQIGDSPRLFPVLFGLWGFHLTRAEYRAAAELSAQLLGLAQRGHDPGLLVEAHGANGVSLLYLGEFLGARTHLEQSLALYDPQQHRAHAVLYGQDPAAAVRAYLAVVLWLLGYPEQALKRSQEVVRYARELGHPMSLAFALGLATILHTCRREPQAAQERAEEVIALAREQGLQFWLAQGVFGRGRALIAQGRRTEGVEQIRQILEAWRSEGKALGRPTTLAAMAEAYGELGRGEQGLTLLTEALNMGSSSGERWWEAELYRLKGELALQPSGQSRESGVKEAEGCFHKAIEIAQQQGAKSWELRAVMSLSRLWQQQGKQHEAHQILAELYGWFTEGFDTKDLQEAKALLEELAA